MKAASPRKACRNCGHQNRLAAKVCVQCGHALVTVDASGTVRKPCPQCGHANRLIARICTQCGHQLVSARPVKRPEGRKWCPQCGAARKPGAKVCTQCGFRFKAPAPSKPIIGTVEPPIALPPAFDAPTPLPTKPAPKAASDNGLAGEPSPYMSSDELNRLRATGPYSPGMTARILNQIIKKDRS